MAEKIICCTTTEISGNIAFGPGCVIHPGATIIAEKGDIVFGAYNIIEERSVIVNKSGKTMNIGNYNHFQVGSSISSCEIGDLNEFLLKSKVESGAKIGNGCIIAAGVTLERDSKLEDHTVVNGLNDRRIRSDMNVDATKSNMKCMVEVLAKQLAKYNQIRTIEQ
mmetsp:Transcript_7591/g.8288  ORF Transcript_7591/g.8288 Transcript_7591/m.8288 type:complete len:165 (+) Transcript_7591:31-525(+)